MAGCRSAWVQTTVVNAQDKPVSLVEVNYPGGSFGVQTIAAHGTYQYRFRALLTGAVTVDFNDAAGKSHTSTGPELLAGQQGSLGIEIEPDGTVQWKPAISGN